MKKQNFRTEIFQLSNEHLVARIEDLKNQILDNIGLGEGYVQRHTMERRKKMLQYAESVLSKRV